MPEFKDNKGFKMKGFSMHGGTDKHKQAVDAARKASVKVQAVNRPQPTYEGTDEFRKEKDIPKSEFKKRGVKSPNKLKTDPKAGMKKRKKSSSSTMCKTPSKALVGKQKNIDVNNNGKIDGDDFKKLKGKSPNKSNCGPTPAKKYKSPAKKYASAAQRKAIHASKEDGGKGAPGKFIAKAAGMLIGANKQRQASKDAAEQAKQKGIESAMSRKL